MRIVLNGAKGRRGRIVDKAAADSGHDVVARVDFGYAEGEGLRALNEYQGPADVVVDFSNHAATAQVTEYCVKRGLPVVVATTGQTKEEQAMIDEAAKAVPVFLSANMSLGVALLADLAKKAAAVFPDADIEIVEKHHNQKLDVPSGTALLLARRICEVRPGAELVVGRHENGKRSPQEIGIHSLRYGGEVGTHEILIATGSETITLKHRAEDRSLFAEGALTAAAFLQGKPAGLYTMEDIIKKEK